MDGNHDCIASLYLLYTRKWNNMHNRPYSWKQNFEILPSGEIPATPLCMLLYSLVYDDYISFDISMEPSSYVYFNGVKYV